ncbi:MAG: Spore germination protein YndE [Pelotomaculum sp. PtaB.Bin104]|nr:MAG: Spore germination protein YndE [Pelotomaculum sp. PtaB.Bin104]
MSNDHAGYKIDGHMTFALLLNYINATAVLLVLAPVRVAGHDSWMSPVIVTPSAAYLIFVVYQLDKLYPGKTIIEYLPLLLGNILGKAVGLGYVLFFAWIGATVIKEFTALIFGTGVFTLTPEIIVILLLIIATTYATAHGLEVIGRVMSLFWLIIVLIYLIFIIQVLPYIKVSALLPVGEAGLYDILKSSFVAHGFRGEYIILAMLSPYIRSSREALLSANIANIMTTFIILVTLIAAITVMGVGITARSYFTPFNIADFLPTVGIKSFLVFTWIIGFWGKAALSQFVVTDGLVKLLGLREQRPIILPVAVLLVVFSLTFYENSTDLFETISRVLPGMGLFFEYLIPTLLLIAGLIRRKAHHRTRPT